MADRVIDLRSDTVSRPTAAMRRAMAEAEVGDDVFGDDPTVNALEERAAELLGKEAGLFVASGTMGNLVAQLAHLGRGQETIAGREHHIVAGRGGRPRGHRRDQHPRPRRPAGRHAATRGRSRPRSATRTTRTSRSPASIALENTHAHSMGQPLRPGYLAAVGDIARRARRALHIDGARFWNAVVARATRIPPATWPARRTP